MNAALNFINLPFYSKQPNQVQTKSSSQTSSVFQEQKVSNLSTPRHNKLEVSQQSVPYHQVDSQLNTRLQTDINIQLGSQNGSGLFNYQQNSIQTEYNRKKMALNFENSNHLLNSNNTHANNDNNLSNNENKYDQINNIVQNPMIESLAQSTPAATSTPNPIQQQQQNLINQDIITNLFLKFDPVQLLQQKDQLSLIASTLAASNSSNQTGKLQGHLGGDPSNSIHNNNLNSFNNLLNNSKINTNDKQDEVHSIIKNSNLSNNMASQHHQNQQHFNKIANTAISQLNQSHK